jgi:Na+/melibiose symporter-like transporter
MTPFSPEMAAKWRTVPEWRRFLIMIELSMVATLILCIPFVPLAMVFGRRAVAIVVSLIWMVSSGMVYHIVGQLNRASRASTTPTEG